MSQPNILVFDIENAPYLIHAWDLWNVNAIDVEREWFMLSFAWGWYDMDKQELRANPKIRSLDQTPGYEPGDIDDKWLALQLWTLLDQADIVVGQNSEKFDHRKVNERFLVHGLTPPSPYQTVDTKRHYQRHFSGSAAMKYMTRKMGLEGKQENAGWPLWKGCMEGDLKSWQDMRRYNKADVDRTAKMYTKLLPWIGYNGKPGGPNMAHFSGYDGFVCPNCGNTEDGDGFQRRGYHYTGAYRYPRFQCKRCSRYARHWKSEPNTRTELR